MSKLQLLVPLCALILAGCASQSGTDSDGAGAGSGQDGSGIDETYGSEYGQDGNPIQIGDDAEAILQNERVIYFAFDSTDIDDMSLEVLKLHGRYLADNPSEKARLEGHADERGTRDYNIGLGERRGVSVESVLLTQGVSANQLTVVSFGEERPANPASTEAAWAENRRVEIVYE